MIDELMEKIDRAGAPVAVGLDPAPDMVPERIRRGCVWRYGATMMAAAEMLLEFNIEVIDGVCDIVPAVKLQVAMYERFGPRGMETYADTAAYARKKGLFVIGDVKRGDVASTSEAYAAHLAGVEFEDESFEPWMEDAVTLNPYLGMEGIMPFIEVCEKRGKAAFILVKTSNPGSAELQDMVLRDSGLTVYEHVAGMVSERGMASVGKHGYSRIGAVVGATCPEQGAALRARMPHTFFLVPGYGAQGASGKDLKGFFDADGKGCVVNSSRGIITAWQRDTRFGDDVGRAAAEAALAMKRDLAEALA
jgi:orotidine-5'-phosphate decarboxylase